MSRRAAVPFLFSAMFVVSAWAGAVSFIQDESVSISQAANRLVTITYQLKGKPGIVTVDILTNGVSIGEANFVNVAGDVNKMISNISTKSTISWQPCKSWPDHVISDSSLSAKVTVWDPCSPPDYMAIDLTVPQAVRYYVSSNAVPYGVQDVRYKTDVLLMRRIHAAGVEWRMGSPAAPGDGETGRRVDEVPHLVTLTRDYYIGVYEVTYGQYRKFVARDQDDDLLMPWTETYKSARGGTWPEGGHGDISSTGFLYLMRDHSKILLDLPTEAQWEYACRAGTRTALANGDATEENASQMAVYGVSSAMHVGTKMPNAWGLYDMHGNRYEWCLDWHGDYAVAACVDPKGPASGEKRVLRGGYYGSSATGIRSAFRFLRDQGTSHGADGFRLCAPIPAEGSNAEVSL